MGKAKEQQESEQERALADVARQQIATFDAKWRPQQQRLAREVVAAGAPDSFERRRAETMAKADTGAAFAATREKVNAGAAASGQFGSSGHKLGLAGVDQDQATSSGLATVAADQATDDAMVSGLNAVTALGRGEKATAVNGMAQAAGIGAAQARADAERSFQNRAGNAQLAGTAAGVGAGLYMARPAGASGVDWAAAPDQLPNETARLQRRAPVGLS